MIRGVSEIIRDVSETIRITSGFYAWFILSYAMKGKGKILALQHDCTAATTTEQV